tara:strand:- start:88699 stop:91119 length:2421 start_codon:yes stop_codon:yes gene_type:complete
MKNSYHTPARTYAPGIGDAVANRTINRKITRKLNQIESKTITLPRQDDKALEVAIEAHCKANGLVIDGFHVDYGDELKVDVTLNVVGRKDTEKWQDVAYRVSNGNTMLCLPKEDQESEFQGMHHHMRQASLLMSGRHLQHGDETQINRNMEVFTNCATSAASFLTFYLLLNGSGVGRSYDDAMMKVDWSNMPIVVPAIGMDHKDVQSGEVNALDPKTARHLYHGSKVHVFEVPDSREGWTKALEKLEVMTFQKKYRKDVLIIDFSKVRPRGSPIRGMQDRPASGPGPLISAINNISQVRDTKMEPWRQTMYIDHYSSECVLVGGARRAARMSTKTWRDKNVMDFIEVKRGGFLWTSNNSVTVDKEFWELVGMVVAPEGREELWEHANKVLDAVTYAAYHDNTGEPGLINQDMLTQNDKGLAEYEDGRFADSKFYQLEDETLVLAKELVKTVSSLTFKMITNPCGEITLIMLGGYCVIADVVPYHAGSTSNSNEEWDADAEDAYRVATRALMRTNLMDCLYKPEVDRTNRIGVGITGLHEYAWARFGFGFRDLIDEGKSIDFWLMMARFKRAVSDEARRYAKVLGTVIPHTDTTIKPAGTTSKLFGLTEGAHLPSMREYLRWVQFRYDDPLVEEYKAKGYPIRELKTYAGTIIVGFPTQPEVCTLGMGDKLVTAAEATPEEQYQYLRLLEKYWIRGVDELGAPLKKETGNQVSYTLKYKPDELSYDEFRETLIAGQASIRCCSVMPQTEASAYEYQPEEMVSKHDYEVIRAAIAKEDEMQEDIGAEHVDCGTSGCPVDFGTNSASEE